MTYTYGCLMRPPEPGAIPKEGLLAAVGIYFTAPSGHRCWGMAKYNRPLTDEEVTGYELEEIPGLKMPEGDER